LEFKMANVKVEFELFGGASGNKKVASDLSVVVPSSKYITSAERGAQRVSWHAKSLGLKAGIISATETDDEATRLKPERKPKEEPAEGEQAAPKAAKKAAAKAPAAAKKGAAPKGASKKASKKKNSTDEFPPTED
jgi:sRNA-binding protein